MQSINFSSSQEGLSAPSDATVPNVCAAHQSCVRCRLRRGHMTAWRHGWNQGWMWTHGYAARSHQAGRPSPRLREDARPPHFTPPSDTNGASTHVLTIKKSGTEARRRSPLLAPPACNVSITSLCTLPQSPSTNFRQKAIDAKTKTQMVFLILTCSKRQGGDQVFKGTNLHSYAFIN